MLSACNGETIRNSAKMARVYFALKNEKGIRVGDKISHMIESIKGAKEAFDGKDATLDSVVAMAVLNSRIEIDTDFPRVAIVIETDDGATVESVYGPMQDRESTLIRARNVAIISGTVLFRLAMLLHFNKGPDDVLAAA
jgi:hypothetical protein